VRRLACQFVVALVALLGAPFLGAANQLRADYVGTDALILAVAKAAMAPSEGLPSLSEPRIACFVCELADSDASLPGRGGDPQKRWWENLLTTLQGCLSPLSGAPRGGSGSNSQAGHGPHQGLITMPLPMQGEFVGFLFWKDSTHDLPAFPSRLFRPPRLRLTVE
jgi:hypothetical protein